ncbi:MAG: hypothetical protein QXS88_02175 [Candidatus Bilamarchaeaceae archaeon]
MANNVFKTRKEEQKGILLLTTPDGDKYVITGNRDLLINLKDKFVTGNIREEDLNGFVVRKKVDNSLIKCSEDDKKRLALYGSEELSISDVRSLKDIYQKSSLLQVLDQEMKKIKKKEEELKK